MPAWWRLCSAPVDMVYHLAANADVSRGIAQPRKDLEQNTIATFNVLDTMREVGVAKLAFSSTGSIYGEPEIVPTPENVPFPIQTSLYGASKLAGEGLIQAFAEGFGFTTWIFRFVSILGERYTHGHIYDFYRKLQNDPTRLEVLGDGYQTSWTCTFRTALMPCCSPRPRRRLRSTFSISALTAPYGCGFHSSDHRASGLEARAGLWRKQARLDR